MNSKEADSIVQQLVLLRKIIDVMYKNISGEMSPEVAIEEIKQLMLTENKDK